MKHAQFLNLDLVKKMWLMVRLRREAFIFSGSLFPFIVEGRKIRVRVCYTDIGRNKVIVSGFISITAINYSVKIPMAIDRNSNFKSQIWVYSIL